MRCYGPLRDAARGSRGHAVLLDDHGTLERLDDVTLRHPGGVAVRVLPADYERVRAHPTHFIYANGHAAGMPQSHVIETLEGAVIVEKNGVPARVARETDPRAASRNAQ